MLQKLFNILKLYKEMILVLLKYNINERIDCWETYPHLNLFRKYFNINIFNENDFKLDEDSNTFTLNNCW